MTQQESIERMTPGWSAAKRGAFTAAVRDHTNGSTYLSMETFGVGWDACEAWARADERECVRKELRELLKMEDESSEMGVKP